MLSCYIIDDELTAIHILKYNVAKTPALQLVGSNTNALEALELFKTTTIDLLFLNIQMLDLTSVELLQLLEKPPMVIFTTANKEYALQDYDLVIADYLVKPISLNRFFKAINKAKKLQSILSGQPKEHFLYVKSDHRYIRIFSQKILYIEGIEDHSKIYTTEKMILVHLNLKKFSEQLPTNKFIQVHHSFIVAFSKIDTFQKGVISIGEKQIPVGIAYQEALFKGLG